MLLLSHKGYKGYCKMINTLLYCKQVVGYGVELFKQKKASVFEHF
jgi:hypothetical protein